MELTKDWAATLDDYVIDLAWAPGGESLAAASAAGPISILSRAGESRHALEGHPAGTNAIAFDPRPGGLLASGGQDGNVRFWEVASGQLRHSAGLGRAWVEHVAWQPSSPGDSPVLAAAAARQLTFLGADGAVARTFEQAPKTITALAWSPRGDCCAAASFGQVALRGLAASGDREFTYNNGIHALVWSPDGKWLVSGNQDASVHLWIPADGSELQMSGYETKVKHLAFDHTGRWLATGGGSESSVWDCSGPGPEGREPAMLPHEAPVCALAFQNTHGLLATASQDGVVMLWSPERKQPLRATVRMPVAAAKLAWSPDDSQLAIGTEKGALYVLRAR